MEIKILAFEFTDTVPFRHEPGAESLRLRDLPGTDGYCSREAEAFLRERISREGFSGVHFLDSGNYHYLTKFFLEQIREPFDLMVFDHHTDMQPPALLPLLSCGSWLKEALEQNLFLRRDFLLGPPEGAQAEIREEERGRLRWITAEQIKKEGEISTLTAEDWPRPVYLSIDKDVLRREDARTNWDQGEMRLEELCGCIRFLGSRAEILGVDICGGEVPATAGGEAINSRTDGRLMECIKEIPKLRR